jgi:hypothetical protein
VRRVKAGELEGYNYIYYALVFCFPGALLGIVARNQPPTSFAPLLSLVAGIFIPAVLLEWILVSTSGRAFSFDYLVLSSLLALAGILWINSDSRSAIRDQSNESYLS